MDHNTDARHFYELAVRSSLRDRFWYDTNQPNWLVDAYALANQPKLFSQVRSEVETFVLDLGGESVVELYASAPVRLLAGREEEANDYLSGLLKKPELKLGFAMGKTIQAIVECDQPAFDDALESLLKAHRGMAKFGGLRETPEGFLCLPAMSLSRIALERGMQIDVDSEYLSKGYLDYLLGPG